MVWVNIPDSDIDQDSPLTVALATAWRDNVQAAIQLDGDPPVAYSTWHPYNMVTVNDGNDGVFWDHAVDGNTSSETSPILVDGFEYAVAFIGVTVSSGSISATIQRDRDNVFFPSISLGGAATIVGFNGWLFAYRARDVSQTHSLEPGGLLRNQENLVYNDNRGTFKILRIRIQGLYNGGKLALYRRAVL